jgi:PAS domain S-box-containing protein
MPVAARRIEMNNSAGSRSWLDWGVRIAGATSAGIGGTWLALWLSGLAAGWSSSGVITVKTNMAVGQLLAGISLLLLGSAQKGMWRRYAAGLAAAVVLMIGTLTLSEHLFRYNLGIDEILAAEPPGAVATASPNRIGPPGSLGLALLGSGLLAMACRRMKAVPYLGVVVFFINLVPALGFIYGIDEFYVRPLLTGIAWPTVIAMVSLGIGLILSHREGGPMALFLRDDEGGLLLRQLLPAVVLIPLALGFMKVQSEHFGFGDTHTGTGLLVLALALVFSILLWRTAARVSDSSAARSQAEQARRLTEHFAEKINESSLNGLYIYDVETGTYVYVNGEFERLTGWSLDRLRELGRDGVIEFFHPEDREGVMELMSRLSRSHGEVLELEHRLRRADGTWMWCFSRNAVFERDAAGNARRLIASFIDVTERKNYEESLRRTAEDLRRSKEELEQFTVVTTHDLQEPLRQVKAFVGLLSKRHEDKLDGKASQYLQFIVDGATRMSSLVQALLAYAEAGARTEPQLMSSRQAFENALGDLRLRISESGARITHEDLPDVVADPDQLRHLFRQLVDNAMKFRREGVSPEIHIGVRRERCCWQFSVKDNGIGISPEHHDRVFMIFQRLHGRDNPGYPGTGIGLAICRKVVEQHGGKIWIDSAAGQGSTFYFTLPVAAVS